MRYVGLDVHKESVEAAFVDENGTKLRSLRVACTREALEAFGKAHLGPDTKVALEATTHCWAVVTVLKPFVGDIVVSNPLKTRAIAEAKIKTDKVDALVLAQLLRTNFLPTVWEPDARTRYIRQLTTRRAALISDRTRLKNRIHAVLHERMLKPPATLFSKAGQEWLEQCVMDPLGRSIIDSDLTLIDSVQAEIDAVDQELATHGYDDARVKLLMTLPGVDLAVAQTIIAALGDVTRFKTADKAASYLGLVPSVRQSGGPGGHCYYGRITKQGRGHARWMLIQAAQHVGRHPGPLGVFFRRISKKKNRNVAVVATARKLVTIAWHMLKNNEPYRYAQPKSTEAKLSRLRVRATGKRRSGPKPGRKRSPTYGSGKQFRTIPNIDQVCEREGLPPPRDLAPGEQRVVKQAGASDFVAEIHEEKRIPRNPKKER